MEKIRYLIRVLHSRDVFGRSIVGTGLVRGPNFQPFVALFLIPSRVDPILFLFQENVDTSKPYPILPFCQLTLVCFTMVMFTGLWNHSNFIQRLNNDDDEVGDASNNNCAEGQSLLRLGRPNSHNHYSYHHHHQNHHGLRQQQELLPFVPRTIEYGSIFAQATSDLDKTVNWDDDTCKSVSNNEACDGDEEKGGDGKDEDNNKTGGAICASLAEPSGSGSVSSSSQTQQDFPSLTAAFQSIENRPILINCFIYLAIYMIMAVVAYSFVLEKWSIIDSLYFAVATL